MPQILQQPLDLAPLPPGAVRALGGPNHFFFPDEHRYFIGDVEVPGTTFLLKKNKLVDDTWYRDEHRDRGHAVHAACHFFDEGDLASYDPAIHPYMVGYSGFHTRHTFKWDLIEMPIIHPYLRYGVQPDRAGLLDGTLGVVEYKTTESVNDKILKAWRIQTAAQLIAVFDVLKIPVVRRSYLRLLKSGTFDLQHFPISDNARDRADFLSILRTHHIEGE